MRVGRLTPAHKSSDPLGRQRKPVSARVFCADNLSLMASLEDGCCDLVYIDPPFDSKRFVCGSEPIGQGDQTGSGLDGYLSFLRPRLTQIRRLLAVRACLYVHLDWRSVHYVKVLLDELFGAACFLNEIIWQYRSGGRSGRWFARKHDTILLYAKCAGRHTFHGPRGGTYRTQGLRKDQNGTPYKATRSGRIHFHPDGPLLSDIWDIPFLSTVSKERTGYPTQKPEALLERIILASSNEGDVVADFFCGSGTTPTVARRLKRRWLACDSSPEAVAITKARLSTPQAAS